MNGQAAICYNVHMETKLSGHTAYRTEYHIVWIPKYRRRILNPGVRGYLKKLFLKILRSLLGYEIIEYNIQVDHIHMVMIITPKYSVSDVIGQIKAQSASRHSGKSFPGFPRYTGKKILFCHQVFLSQP